MWPLIYKGFLVDGFFSHRPLQLSLQTLSRKALPEVLKSLYPHLLPTPATHTCPEKWARGAYFAEQNATPHPRPEIGRLFLSLQARISKFVASP